MKLTLYAAITMAAVIAYQMAYKVSAPHGDSQVGGSG